MCFPWVSFFNLDSSEHSKGFDHTDSSIPVPLISLDQMPMSTMLSEASLNYYDSSQSFEMPYISTTPQTVTPQTEPLRRSPRKKITLPAMPVEDEISYNKQQFTVSSDPQPRPISSYLPRTPSRKTNTCSSGQFTSLTDSPLLTTHLPKNNMVSPMKAQKNYSQTDHFTSMPTDSPMATNSSTYSNIRISPRKMPTSTSSNITISPRKMPPKSTLEVENSTEKNNVSKL